MSNPSLLVFSNGSLWSIDQLNYGTMTYHLIEPSRLFASACAIYQNRRMCVFNPKRLILARHKKHALRFSLYVLILVSVCFRVNAQTSESLLPQYQHAESLADQGRYDIALTEYQKVLYQNPEFAEAYSGIGYVYWNTGKPDQALKAFKNALTLNNRLLKAHIGIGHILSARREHQEAIAHYKMALEINPELGWLHSTLADLLSAQHQELEAVRHYQTAIELNPKLAPSVFWAG